VPSAGARPEAVRVQERSGTAEGAAEAPRVKGKRSAAADPNAAVPRAAQDPDALSGAEAGRSGGTPGAGKHLQAEHAERQHKRPAKAAGGKKHHEPARHEKPKPSRPRTTPNCTKRNLLVHKIHRKPNVSKF